MVPLVLVALILLDERIQAGLEILLVLYSHYDLVVLLALAILARLVYHQLLVDHYHPSVQEIHVFREVQVDLEVHHMDIDRDIV